LECFETQQDQPLLLCQNQVLADDSPLQTEPLNFGLVMQPQDPLEESNYIASESVFNQISNDQELARSRLFNQSTIKLFKLDEKASRPDILLKEVLLWTGSQPFLTLKLCQLLCALEALILEGEEATTVQHLVQTRMIHHWEAQVASEHLKAIRKGLLSNQQCDPLLLLKFYQQILHQGEVPSDESPAKAELLNLGLVVQQGDKLKVANRIYQSVFDRTWVMRELTRLGFFSHNTIKLFKLDERASRPNVLLNEVLAWTRSQPFLTQKLCQLLCDLEVFIPAGEEATTVAHLVQSRLIHQWETQIASDHFKAMREGLLKNQQCDPLLLLRLYEQILRQEEVVASDSPAQTELLNLGLVVQQQDKLKVANRIYQSVFDRNWVNRELARIRPFSHNTIKLFKLDEKASCPEILLEEILSWTGAQSFLTQKLCQLLSESESFIHAGQEAVIVEKLVQSHIIHDWETQVASEHLQPIHNGLLKNQRCNPLSLLRLYQQILQQGEVLVDESSTQAELLNLGLVVQQENRLKVANRIYQSVFNQSWVTGELARLGFFSQRIKLFKLDEKASYPDVVLEEILLWTGAQPFLTQKLCQLLHESESFIHAGEEAVVLQHLVQTRLIHNWETQAASEHLTAIQEGLVGNQHWEPLVLLRLYQQILQQGEVIVPDNPAYVELLNLGLVVQQQETLKVANRIYQSVFNQNWVIREMEKMFQTSSFSEITKIAKKTTDSEINFFQKTDNISSSKGAFSQRIWLLVGTVSVIVIGFNIVCFGLYKWVEEKQLFRLGNDLFKQGEYKEAIEKYNKVLNIDSNYYQAWTNRGYALAGLQQYNKMLESCTAATIIEPKAVYAWNCQGEALHNLKNHEEAIAAFDKAIAIDAKDPVFRINKAESLLALKQTDSALATINEAIQLLRQNKEANDPQTLKRDLSIAFSHKGKILLQKQAYEEALKAYDQALAIDPKYFFAQRGRGLTLQGLRRYDDAIAQFEEILNNDKLTNAQQAETRFYLGLTLCRSSRPQEGLVALEEALKLKADYLSAKEAKNNCQ
jgi:tetratricopeptide (TPR) repeat protein